MSYDVWYGKILWWSEYIDDTETQCCITECKQHVFTLMIWDHSFASFNKFPCSLYVCTHLDTLYVHLSESAGLCVLSLYKQGLSSIAVILCLQIRLSEETGASSMYYICQLLPTTLCFDKQKDMLQYPLCSHI